MKILHIENTSGVAIELARGQRALGHEATVLETYRPPFAFEHDISNFYEGSLYEKARKVKYTLQLAKGFDVVHVHAGMPWKRFDYLWIREVLDKPMVVHYHGCETRMGYGMHYQNIADAKIVATPDLLRFHPRATFIPNPMAPKEMTWEEGPLRIVHAPTNRIAKGTAAIIQAVDVLRSEGRTFDFELVEKRPHTEAMATMARSHIVVDQVTKTFNGSPAGLLGMVSLEGMAMGKAVVNSLDPSAFGRYYPSGYPGVYADEANIKEVLGSLLDDPEEVRRLGEKGRKWISEHLSPEVIATQHVEIYESVLGE